jgi:putative Mg2+ transporter-C (MgtC) family protein
MTLVHQVERRLPGRQSFDVSITFRRDATPELDDLERVAQAHGYRLVRDSLSCAYPDSQPVWRFCVVALDRSRATSPARLAHELSHAEELTRFSIVPMRN